MARVALTDDQVAKVLAAPKTVTDSIKWQAKGHVDWVACEAGVENALRLTLHIHANANLVDRKKFAFSLVLSRNYRVASFESCSSHRNRHTNDQRWLGQPHKHRWTELCRDSFAYTPTDIDTRSVETAFRSFCKEIGVDFLGNVEQVPATQTALQF